MGLRMIVDSAARKVNDENIGRRIEHERSVGERWADGRGRLKIERI